MAKFVMKCPDCGYDLGVSKDFIDISKINEIINENYKEAIFADSDGIVGNFRTIDYDFTPFYINIDFTKESIEIKLWCNCCKEIKCISIDKFLMNQIFSDLRLKK